MGLNEQSAAALTDAEASPLEVGSKALFAAWISYVSLILSLEASLLCFYSRLTHVSLPSLVVAISAADSLTSDLDYGNKNLFKIIAIICFTAYVAVIFTLFGHCTPIQKKWQVKPYAGGSHLPFSLTSLPLLPTLHPSTDIPHRPMHPNSSEIHRSNYPKRPNRSANPLYPPPALDKSPTPSGENSSSASSFPPAYSS